MGKTEQDYLAVPLVTAVPDRAIEELMDDFLDGKTYQMYRTHYGLTDCLMDGLDHEGACHLLARLYLSREKDDTALEFDAAFKTMVKSWLETSDVGKTFVVRKTFDLEEE